MANQRRDLVKEQRWRDVVERQLASGLSGRAFCRRAGLSEASFYAWRRTLGKRDDPSRQATQPLAFVPAMVTSEPRAGFVLELSGVSGGRVLRLPEAITAERLAEFVVALEMRGGR